MINTLAFSNNLFIQTISSIISRTIMASSVYFTVSAVDGGAIAGAHNNVTAVLDGSHSLNATFEFAASSAASPDMLVLSVPVAEAAALSALASGSFVVRTQKLRATLVAEPDLCKLQVVFQGTCCSSY